MSSHYKRVHNQKGTELIIREGTDIFKDSYLSVGADGKDVMIRGAGLVYAFDTWEQFLLAINPEKAVYVCDDHNMMGK